jgi:hypothetical protein
MASPREALVDALATAARGALLAGDAEAARVALDALERLIPKAGASAPVVDLASRRGRGGES